MDREPKEICKGACGRSVIAHRHEGARILPLVAPSYLSMIKHGAREYGARKPGRI